VVWLAPLADLSGWHSHGASYRRTLDPANRDGGLRLYVPDVVRGVDGRYYLHSCRVGRPQVGVAFSHKPAGPFRFLGLVQDAEGHPLRSRPGDAQPFDPAVLVEADRVWLYTGSGPLRPSHDRKKRQASVVTELAPDMTTMIELPRRLIPTVHDSAGSGFGVASSSRPAPFVASETSTTSSIPPSCLTSCVGRVLRGRMRASSSGAG
jgi:hypothetical protein